MATPDDLDTVCRQAATVLDVCLAMLAHYELVSDDATALGATLHRLGYWTPTAPRSEPRTRSVRPRGHGTGRRS